MQYAAIGEYVRGASHIASGAPCQDAIKIFQNEDYIICSVADGHGSPNCPYSDEGAMIAVEIAEQYLCELYAQTDDLYGYLRSNKDIHFPKKIEQLWKDTVKNRHASLDREMISDSGLYILYGSTLLSVFATAGFIFSFQIGDGNMLEVAADGTTNYWIETEKILGSETDSLCNKECWRYFKLKLVKIPEISLPGLIILNTDGYANSFEFEEDFLTIGKDYLSLLNENGPLEVQAHLKGFLENASETGSGDDISLVIIILTEEETL